VFTDEACDDCVYWQGQDKKTLKRINDLIKAVLRSSSPLEGIGKPEPLRGNLSAVFSRRIGETNRLVYGIPIFWVSVALRMCSFALEQLSSLRRKSKCQDSAEYAAPCANGPMHLDFHMGRAGGVLHW
jgi:toxin YoeB